jgi:hypothetical protein
MYSSSKSSRSGKSSRSSSGYGLLGYLKAYKKDIKTRRKNKKKEEKRRRKREEKLLQERLKQQLIDDEEFKLFNELKKYENYEDAFNIAKYIIYNKDRENNGSILKYFYKTYSDIDLLTYVINSIRVKADVDDCYKILLKFLQKYQMECWDYKDSRLYNNPDTNIDFSDCYVDINLK